MILKAPLNCLLDEKTSVNTGDISLPRLRLGIRRTVSGVPGKIGIQTVNTLRVFRDPDRNDRGGHIHIRPAFQPPVPAGTLADHCQGIVNFLLVRFLEKNHKIEVVVVENLIDVELSGQRTADHPVQFLLLAVIKNAKTRLFREDPDLHRSKMNVHRNQSPGFITQRLPTVDSGIEIHVPFDILQCEHNHENRHRLSEKLYFEESEDILNDDTGNCDRKPER